MESTISLGRSNYQTRLLTPPDIAALQNLFDRCSDYFEIATGAPALPDEATRAFVAGPPSKDVADKRVVGFFLGEELVGVLDALKDWPEDGVWTMGMLLIDPAHRGKGLGSSALETYEVWSRGEGSARFRTAVVSHHTRGLEFLERAGYQRDKTFDNYEAGSQISAIQFLEKKV